MTIEELKKLFEKYDLFTLDSLDVLINYLDETERKEIFPAFKSVYTKKYKEVEREFEGINEYDFICKLLNFDIQDIIDSIESLNRKEIEFISKVINKALLEMDLSNKENHKAIYYANKYEKERKIFEKYAKHYNNTIDDKLSNEELEKFFNKYNAIELKFFNTLFNTACYSLNVYRLYKIHKKVSNNKLNKINALTKDEYNKLLSKNKISHLNNKTELLNDIELELLNNLVEASSDFLNYLKAPEYKDLSMDMDRLEYSLFEEIKNRKKRKIKTKIIK